MTDADIIAKIRKYMSDKNMSINMLAQKSDISQSTLSSMMNRENLPTLPTLVKICNGLNITLSQFFSDHLNEENLLTEKQNQLLLVYNAMNEQNQNLLHTIAVDILDSQKTDSCKAHSLSDNSPYVVEQEERSVAEATDPFQA